MRITKKYTGDSCIGKRIFQPLSRAYFTDSGDQMEGGGNGTTGGNNGNSSGGGNNNSSSGSNSSSNDDINNKTTSPLELGANQTDKPPTDTDPTNPTNPPNNPQPQSQPQSDTDRQTKALTDSNNSILIETSRRELKILRRIWLEKMLGAEREVARKNCAKSTSAVKHSSGRNKVRTWIILFL